MSVRLYFHSLFILGIILNLEFHILLKPCLRVSRGVLNTLLNIYDEVCNCLQFPCKTKLFSRCLDLMSDLH